MQQVNLTPRGRGAKMAKREEFLPVFDKPTRGKESWDPEVHERLMMRHAEGLSKRGIGRVQQISLERMAEIRASGLL